MADLFGKMLKDVIPDLLTQGSDGSIEDSSANGYALVESPTIEKGTTYNVQTLTTPATQVKHPTGLYLITSCYQSNNNSSLSGGSYWMQVQRNSAGSYHGSVIAFGNTEGFSAPPSIDTSGVITLNLASFHKGVIRRIF